MTQLKQSRSPLVSHGNRNQLKGAWVSLDDHEERIARLEQSVNPSASTPQTFNSTQTSVIVEQGITATTNTYTPKTQVNVVGTKNGINKNFALPDVPAVANAERLYINDLPIKRGKDYTITGKYIVYIGTRIPRSTDTFDADYFV